jgi:exosortase A
MQTDSVTTPSRQVAEERTDSSRWSGTLALLALVIAALIGAFYGTAESIVATWLRSGTFAHGFLIVPISLWLVWEKRAGLRRLTPQPAYLPLLLMLPLGFGWLLGYLVDVLVVQQFAFVGLLILAIWSVLGKPVSRYLAFPLAFLLFGVPVGEGLIYPMMNFTADFTVGMLRLTGIPVYRDGTFFSIPSGDWSVVEACSGVRYLIAAVTLGVLYAYLTYTRWWKRLLFVAISVLVPIIANGFRAYMIVMIGHLSDMKLAVGVDHLIYGWVFFGIVVAIMFLVGAFWRDPAVADPTPNIAPAGHGHGRSAVLAAVAAVFTAGLWPGIAWTLEDKEFGDQIVDVRSPPPAAGWRSESQSLWDWRPEIVGADGESYGFYLDGEDGPVGLSLGVYRSQRQNAELLSSQNQMVREKHPVWRDTEQTTRTVQTERREMEVRQHRLASNDGKRLLVWTWYRVGERYTANPYYGKLLEARSILLGQRRDASLITIAASHDEWEQPAEARLQAFMDAMLPAIGNELEQALSRSP